MPGVRNIILRCRRRRRNRCQPLAVEGLPTRVSPGAVLLVGGLGLWGNRRDGHDRRGHRAGDLATSGREYHIAAVGGSNEDEVSVDLADVLNALGAQDWDLKVAMPLKDSDTLLLIFSREQTVAAGRKAGGTGLEAE